MPYTVNSQYNPSEIAGKWTHMPVRKAIAYMALRVLQSEDGTDIHKENKKDLAALIDKDKIYIDIKDDHEGLTIHFGESRIEQAKALMTRLQTQLKALGLAEALVTVDEDGDFKISSINEADADDVHTAIGQFVNYTLQSYKISGHSYLRDLYCVKEGPENGLQGKDVTEATKVALRQRFSNVHAAYQPRSTMSALTTKLTASNARKFVPAQTNSEGRYKLMNAMIHAMQLAKEGVSYEVTDAEKALTTPLSVERKEGLTFVENGDYFAEISELTDEDNARIISADNGFRPGGAAVIASPGSMEEQFCRMSDYLTKITEHLPKTDPIRQIVAGVYMQANPTGKKIQLNASFKDGLPSSLANTTIPEYISRDDCEKLIAQAEKASKAQNKDGVMATAKDYNQHKKDEGNAPLIERVTVKTYAGIATIAVVGMVGVDCREPGTLTRQFMNSQELDAQKDFHTNGKLDMAKVGAEQETRWQTAMVNLLKPDSDGKIPKRVILNAVGCGAFAGDAKHGAKKVSAEAFATALTTQSDALDGKTPMDYIKENNIQVRFPFIRQDQALRETFQTACNEVGVDFTTEQKAAPQVVSDSEKAHDIKTGMQ